MRKYKNIILATTVIFMGAVSISASADTIKIGINVPLTGFAAADGQSALHGAELAVTQVNDAGGINGDMIELVVYDDQASPKESAPLAVKMITKDEVVAGISGSYSGATRAAATIFAESKVPYISAYAIHPDITRAGDYVFRTSGRRFLGSPRMGKSIRRAGVGRPQPGEPRERHRRPAASEPRAEHYTPNTRSPALAASYW